MQLVEILSISVPLPLNELFQKQLKELQKRLTILAYPVANIDGLTGKNSMEKLQKERAYVIC